MIYTIARINDRWVHVVKFAAQVAFSPERDWFMICMDWEKISRKRDQFKWVPASTRFDAVKEIRGS